GAPEQPFLFFTSSALEHEPCAESQAALTAGCAVDLSERVAGRVGAVPGVGVSPPEAVRRVVRIDVDLRVTPFANGEALEQRHVQVPEAETFRATIALHVSLSGVS